MKCAHWQIDPNMWLTDDLKESEKQMMESIKSGPYYWLNQDDNEFSFANFVKLHDKWSDEIFKDVIAWLTDYGRANLPQSSHRRLDKALLESDNACFRFALASLTVMTTQGFRRVTFEGALNLCIFHPNNRMYVSMVKWNMSLNDEKIRNAWMAWVRLGKANVKTSTACKLFEDMHGHNRNKRGISIDIDR